MENSILKKVGISFVPRLLFDYYDEGTAKVSELLIQSTELSHLRRSNCGAWIHMDNLDFLSNFKGITEFIKDSSRISKKSKTQAISALEFIRFSYLTAMEIVGKSRIKNLDDLLKYDSGKELEVINTGVQKYFGEDPAYKLKSKIKSTLLSNTKGTTYLEIEELLPIRSQERFRELSSEITSYILANDKERRGLTEKINKPLEEYSIGEALVLSCYFARNVITKYKKLEDSIKDIFMGEFSSAVSGKCTDFTGLALHYLREYLIPMQKNKFKNWSFGFESDSIGCYQHCYIKAIHINQDMTADVYFLDPTRLSKKGISELKNPKKIINQMKMNDSPIMIQRDAEDLMIAAKENYNK